MGQIYKSDETLKSDTSDWDLRFDSDKAPTVELNPNEHKEINTKKKKKRKKKVFYGIKTKKRFIYTYAKKGRYIEEKFHILKKKTYREPDPYAYDKYYYGVVVKKSGDKERKVMQRHDHKKEYGMPMHGTYEKTLLYKDGRRVLLEKGIFYCGTKHGRWEKYRTVDSLITVKEKYYKGFPKDAEITYYDNKKTEVKEVIPYQLGEKEGTYLRYFKSGRLAEHGRYKFGVKVGTWTEFYDKDEKNFKKLTKHRDPKDEDELWASKFEPQVTQEWNSKGKRITNKKATQKKKKKGTLDLKMPGSGG